MDIIDWKKCEEKFIRKVEIDKERVRSIQEKAMQRLELINKIDMNEKNVSFIVEGYYEVIKESLVAYLLLHGLRSKNHQCLISFFYKNNPDMEHKTDIIAKMSFYRNRLGYYGETIPTTFFEENKEVIKEIIENLNSMVKTNLK